MHRWRSGKRQEAHSRRGKPSLASEEFSITLFVLRDPGIDGLFWNITDWREFISSATKASQQESHEFLLLIGGKDIGGAFDFQKRAHRKKYTRVICICKNRMILSDAYKT
jgi:hypothetical protein